jgi:sec-independent protein translocase protein TatA
MLGIATEPAQAYVFRLGPLWLCLRWYIAGLRARHAMGDIGIPELLILLVIIIIVFGPSRLAGAGKALGEAIRGFRHELRDDDAANVSGEEHHV